MLITQRETVCFLDVIGNLLERVINFKPMAISLVCTFPNDRHSLLSPPPDGPVVPLVHGRSEAHVIVPHPSRPAEKL